jgi:hypothetical protein
LHRFGFASLPMQKDTLMSVSLFALSTSALVHFGTSAFGSVARVAGLAHFEANRLLSLCGSLPSYWTTGDEISLASRLSGISLSSGGG